MISAIRFKDGKFKYDMDINAKTALDYLETPEHVWIDVVKEDRSDIEDMLRVLFPEHYFMILDDCTRDAKPKLQFFENFIFMVFKSFPDKNFQPSQLNVILGKDTIITIRDGKTDVSKLQESLMKRGKLYVDYVLYKMLDTVFENYYGMLDAIEVEVQTCEAECVTKPNTTHLKHILHLKNKLLKLHRILAHERDMFSTLIKSGLEQVRPENTIYFRDVYDDVLHLIDTEETLRDTLSSNIEIYLSSVNNSINEIMKFLTMVSAFVMVPTLIAGIYGMNFRYMPEIENALGYPFALILMGISVVCMIVLFKRKGWF